MKEGELREVWKVMEGEVCGGKMSKGKVWQCVKG